MNGIKNTIIHNQTNVFNNGDKVKDLAILGGDPVINYPFPKHNPIGIEEKKAATKVIESGNLSNYLGSKGKNFFGGHYVRKFEKNISKYFNVKHAITVNSWTSGLITAVGAIGIEPGDEIIVTPWTMSATATAILHWNAIPVFADINMKTFNLDPSSIRKNISKHTKAIIVADIFGQSADIDEIMLIAKSHDLKVISDAAQSPGAKYKNKFAGTLADVGGFSLNYHKHIHTGEGGFLVTNDDETAHKMRLIRNHAEVVIETNVKKELINMLGYNFRLGEIECAIGIEQLKKLDKIVKKKKLVAEKLNQELKSIDGLIIPHVEKDRDHVYYVYGLKLDLSQVKVSKEIICKALSAEGLELYPKYQNIHLLPMYQKKIAYGSGGFPWSSSFCKRDINYSKGICPVAEELQDLSFFGFGLCSYDLNDRHIELIVQAFNKVWDNLGKLKKLS